MQPLICLVLVPSVVPLSLDLDGLIDTHAVLINHSDLDLVMRSCVAAEENLKIEAIVYLETFNQQLPGLLLSVVLPPVICDQRATKMVSEPSRDELCLYVGTIEVNLTEVALAILVALMVDRDEVPQSHYLGTEG
jgi:hypothetical protein